MKLGVIGGAGLLGATTAFNVAAKGIVEEIILYDLRENMAISHAMDIDQGVSETTGTKVIAGSFDDLKDCNIILNTAGIPEKKVASRAEALGENVKIFEDIASKIKAWETSPIILTASNPVDPLNYILYKAMEGSPLRNIGFSRNDSLRFRWSIALETGLPVSEIEAYAIAEHGDNQVPLFSTVKRTDTGEPLVFTDVQKQNILERVKNWFANYQKLDSGRSSGWTSGIGLAKIIEMFTIDSDNSEILSCSVIPGNAYGLSDLSIGLPVRLGTEGVKEIIHLDLSDQEKEGLFIAAEKIKNMITQDK